MQKFKKNDPVWVRWNDSMWYPATIKNDSDTSPDTFSIRWVFDGEWDREATTTVSNIRARAELAEGQLAIISD